MNNPIMNFLFAVGARTWPQGWLGKILPVYAAGIAVWVYYAVTIALIDRFALTAIFISLIYGLLFLIVSYSPNTRTERPGVIDFILSALSVGCATYFALNAGEITARISLLDPLTSLDLFIGTTFWILTLEATRRSVGIGLTLIVVCFVAYNLFGHLFDGVLSHGYISYQHFLDQTVFTTFGIFGAPARVAATYAFLFVAFGLFLQRAGGGDFFFNLAAAISGKSPGGPAKVAVTSSALFGTISGSPTSDVVTTGSITIPMMKKIGYPASLAGAVEVAASAGGGILPPVMGSAAFIMVEITGITYKEIVIAAIIPAILYYVGVYFQVHLKSLKLGLKGMEESKIPKIGKTLKEGGVFVVPLSVIVVALFLGFSPSLVAAFGTVAVLLVSIPRAATRLSLVKIFEVLKDVSINMVPVTAACAAAGLVIGGISMTGLSGKLAIFIAYASGDVLIIVLLIAAFVTIVLGMGMPTPSAYIMSAVLVGPVLVDAGIPLLNAHMFLLFFAALSAITPPVAVAAYAAASIAQANPIVIAGLAVRIAFAGFILPFAFVGDSGLLAQGSLPDIFWAVTTTLFGIVGLSIAAEGFLDRHLVAWQRIAVGFSGGALVMPGFRSDLIGGIGLIVIAFPSIVQFLRNRHDLSVDRDST
jgi:TRAP transporter 4TM/12TM fusion protein